MLKFEQKLAETWPPSERKEAGVVVAVSGGADSVALLRAFSNIPSSRSGRHVVAHFNHGLRPPESDKDEQFVGQLAQSLGFAFVAERAAPDSMQQRSGSGLEATARRLRYAFFERAAARSNCRFVATAHTADDQVETVLHRIVRGTGLAGLAGIPRTRSLGDNAFVIRPLLEFTRQEVLQYLEEVRQPYRHDASNDQLHFTRNRIRHQLLPLLKGSFNDRIDNSILRLSQLAAETQEVIHELVQRLRPHGIVSLAENRAVFSCDPLSDEPRYVVRELMIKIWRDMSWPQQSMGFRQWDLLADLAQLPLEQLDALTCMFPGEITAQRKGGQLTLTRP